MNAEIIGVGSELLLGQISNTDAQYLSRQLSSLGIDVFWHTVVGDNRDRLLQTLRIASDRSDIIITTGGLGPTMDDLSKETVAEFLGLDLVLHQPSLKRIREHFAATGRTMTKNNIKQAMFPRESIILQNDIGTAPGAVMEDNGKSYIVLPGPPSELQHMFDHYAFPYLKRKSGQGIYSRVLRIYGIGESAVEEKVKDLLENQKNPTLAPLIGVGEVTLRITAKASSPEEGEALIRPMQQEIEKRLGTAIYGFDEDRMESVVVNLLREKGRTLSVAESCTGGLVSNRITNVPGSSAVLLEGCVTYSNQAKTTRLGVSPKTLAAYGAVSTQTALEMAEGIRNTSKSDIGIATTGIAGPGGGSPQKPIGLVHIAIADQDGARAKELHLDGDRMLIKNGSAMRLLNWLRLYLLSLK